MREMSEGLHFKCQPSSIPIASYWEGDMSRQTGRLPSFTAMTERSPLDRERDEVRVAIFALVVKRGVSDDTEA